MMGGTLLILSTLIVIGVCIQDALVESEEPSASSWLKAEWPDQNDFPELVMEDNLDGCICRFRPYGHAVCYGGRRCHSFPKNLVLPPGILDLRMKTTEIKNISRGDLTKFTKLQTLWIDANNNLREIKPGTFLDMGGLLNLSVSYNSGLKFINQDTFDGLLSLKVLRLVKNGFNNIMDVSISLRTQYLPSLKFLSLCENSFPKIEENAFANLNGSSVEELELVLCQITEIHPSALVYFKKLKTLRIGDNLIDEDSLARVLKKLVESDISVELLNLYNSGFRRDEKLTELLDTIADLKVSHLILARNHIETISVGLFPRMESLKILDLREVSAVHVEPGALDESLLPNLTVLLMARNKLSGIIPGVRLAQLSFLDLSENSYSPSSYFDVAATSENQSISLTSLDLSYNRVSTVRRNTFKNFNGLEKLGLKNATLYYVSKRAFADLSNLKILNLENNPFAPFNKFETTIFSSVTNLEVLYLGNCKITSFVNPLIFANLTMLRYLSLRDNDLIQIDSVPFGHLPSLTGIDLSENRIQPWSERRLALQETLKIAIFSSNRLHTITVAMIQDLANVTRADLSSNAFTCDCWSFNKTISWLNSDAAWALNSSVLLNNDLRCSAPDSWKEKLLNRFLVSEDNCFQVPGKPLSTPVYIFMAVVLVISVILGLIVYIYRWYIRYWMFLARMSFLRRHGWLLKKNKVYPGDYKYDVFVSYSHEDRSFIVRLVTMLENQHPFLKLCVYERDFEIGTVISTTVMEKVAMSRRILLVISNSFAKSQWCMWELQLAESHRLFFRNTTKPGFRNDPLVMIRLGPIAPVNMTPTLKFLLKSRIYLEWNHDAKKQVVFWQKLRSTLSPQEIPVPGYKAVVAAP